MTKTKLVAAADPFEVALWRGETAMVRVPDYTELGDAPAGIGVKVGVLKPVKYLTHVYRLQRSECFDRVEWNSKNVDGPRVAEVSVPADAKPGMYACGLMDIRVVDPMHDGSFRDWHAGDMYFAYPDGSPSIRFLELRNGIVAAEKLRILREQGLFADEIAALARRFDHREAIANRSDFRKLRADTLKLVNKEVAQ